ncbi:MAG: glycosyltransferase family 4 protein [Anaerolineales bacterium]|nr:glycosyltransferase family 4 protein [Anaerolineales bacterium]
MARVYRIAMVAACPFPTSQGSQVLIRQLAETLAARRHAVHLVTYHLGEPAAAAPAGVQLHRAPAVPGYRKLGSGPAWGKLWLDLLLLLTLWRVVRREAVDVIHAHNYEALLIGWLVGRLTGVPVVYHSHNVMAAELPTYFRSAWARRAAAGLARLLDRELPRRAQACLALSPEAVEFYAAHGVAAERLWLVPPGIEFGEPPAGAAEAARLRHGLGAGPLVIYTGNLDQYQRVAALVRGFERVRAAAPAAQLVIASHGSAGDYQAVLAEAGPAPGVRFVRSASFEETRALLLAAEVAVCPRMACFGFPIKLLNYMAAGKAVVAARGSAKGLRHLENGYVAEDDEALMAGVVQLLEQPAMAARLGAAARLTVETRFHWGHAAREIERCYASLTGERAEPALAEGRLGRANF